MNWWLAKAGHIEGVEGVARELKYRFGALPQPGGNPLYMVRIEILAMRTKVGSISTQEKQVVIRPLETAIASEAKQSPSRGHDGVASIGHTNKARCQASGI
jgi:transcription-repair coupling factor (superfamily II helicase)